MVPFLLAGVVVLVSFFLAFVGGSSLPPVVAPLSAGSASLAGSGSFFSAGAFLVSPFLLEDPLNILFYVGDYLFNLSTARPKTKCSQEDDQFFYL